MSAPTPPACQCRQPGAEELGTETLEAVADRGYYEGSEIKACADAGITVTLPKPQTSGAKAEGRFGKQDFVYDATDDVYRCPAGEQLTYRFTREEHGNMLRRYWTSACTLPTQGRVHARARAADLSLGHEAVLRAVQARLDNNPDAMRLRRQTAEHPFGTIKCWMGWTHFLTMTLPKVATEMALNVLAYNMSV